MLLSSTSFADKLRVPPVLDNRMLPFTENEPRPRFRSAFCLFRDNGMRLNVLKRT